MRKILLSILCILAFGTCAYAHTLLLRTGTRVQGTIVFENDEVVIIRNAEGARFQYLRSDIDQILTDEEVETSKDEETSQEVQQITTSKKATILLELAGGMSALSGEKLGGAVSADLLVGSHHIGEKHIFIGGGLGYHGMYMGGETYNFLPIQVALRMPFTEAKHAPVFGMTMGYGVALSKDYIGGIYAAVDLGYRCQLNPRTAIGIVAFAQFQQAYVPVTTTIEGSSYTSKAGRYPVATGLKMTLYF